MRKAFIITVIAIAVFVCVLHWWQNPELYPGVPPEVCQKITNIQNEPGTICWLKAQEMADLFVDYGETAVVLAVGAPPRANDWHVLVRYGGKLVPVTENAVLCTAFFDIAWTKGMHITEEHKRQAAEQLGGM